MSILRKVIAALLGAVAGSLVVGLIEGLGTFLYPPPADLDYKDPLQFAAFGESLPLGAFLIVLAAWGAACIVASVVARWMAPGRAAWPALAACALITAAAIANMILIPHPTWFWFAGIATCLGGSLLGFVVSSPTQYTIHCSRRIDAPLERVFRTIATVDEFAAAVPGIVKIEVLTKPPFGAGTRFLETREMKGRESTVEMTVSELVENQRITLTAQMAGVDWKTTFVVSAADRATELQMTMRAAARTIVARAMAPLMMAMVRPALEQDLDAVRVYCERA